MLKTLSFWLKVSRPGLWFATLWLYLLPTSQMDVLDSTWFWLGLFYVSFPLNFLVYGWNDIADKDIDRLNPRKDSFLFGAMGTDEQLDTLKKVLPISQILFFTPFIYWAGWQMAALFAALLLVNWLYNKPVNGLRSMPPFEMLCQFGYLLVAPFSIMVNQTGQLPWQTYVYLALFAVQSHLIGEVMDIHPDREAGRKTTATVMGTRKTKLIIIAIVTAEVLLLFGVYDEYIFGGMLALALLWLLLDLFFIYKTNQYSLTQMKLFAIMSNIVAILSMSYVWYSGCLLSVD